MTNLLSKIPLLDYKMLIALLLLSAPLAHAESKNLSQISAGDVKKVDFTLTLIGSYGRGLLTYISIPLNSNWGRRVCSTEENAKALCKAAGFDAVVSKSVIDDLYNPDLNLLPANIDENGSMTGTTSLEDCPRFIVRLACE